MISTLIYIMSMGKFKDKIYQQVDMNTSIFLIPVWILPVLSQASSKTLLVLTANPSAMGNSIEIGLLPV